MQSGGPNRERLYRAAAMILHHTFFPKNRVHFYLTPVRLAQAAPRIMPPAFILFSSVSICFNLFEYVPIMSDDVINSKHGEILDTAQGPTYHKHPVEFTAC